MKMVHNVVVKNNLLLLGISVYVHVVVLPVHDWLVVNRNKYLYRSVVQSHQQHVSGYCYMGHFTPARNGIAKGSSIKDVCSKGVGGWLRCGQMRTSGRGF